MPDEPVVPPAPRSARPGAVPDPADMRAMVSLIYWEAMTRREKYVRFVDAPMLKLLPPEPGEPRDRRPFNYEITRQNLHMVEALAANDQVIISAALALGLTPPAPTPPEPPAK